jgi:hypothetical protein
VLCVEAGGAAIGVQSELAYAFVPVAVVIGVLRYRLLGIEVVLRRGLLYVPLTVIVALTVGGLTTALARLIPEGPLPCWWRRRWSRSS